MEMRTCKIIPRCICQWPTGFRTAWSIYYLIADSLLVSICFINCCNNNKTTIKLFIAQTKAFLASIDVFYCHRVFFPFFSKPRFFNTSSSNNMSKVEKVLNTDLSYQDKSKIILQQMVNERMKMNGDCWNRSRI